MNSRLIEVFFPVREVSTLAVPERSSYKPIYQISKWFARRSSSTFRAIILGSILKNNEDLMNQFYSDHNFSNITVFDPFMGGGTTIIEALRLGLNCVGIDINPVAWFITKTEAEGVDIEKLRKIIDDCDQKLSKKIKKWYLTNCPICSQQADIIYAHWVSLVKCKFCKSSIPLFKNYIVGVKGKITFILCPECESVFNSKSPLKNKLVCPKCKISFNPLKGNRIGHKRCICRKCGNQTDLLEYRRKYQEILPTKLFAIEGFCRMCAKEENKEFQLIYSDYKFIKGISKQDINLFKQAERQWQQEGNKLLWPKGFIPLGFTTKTLQNHNYQKWEEMFNRRQLLALSTILTYINEINDQSLQEMFLAAFINLLNHNNVFTRYSPKGKKVEGIFARHDFHILKTYAENNVWGTKYGRGTWIKCLNRLLKGKQYNDTPYDSIYTINSNGRKKMKKVYSGKINGKLMSRNCDKFPSREVNLLLLCQDSADISDLPIRADLIISDPPYADNIHYSELSDFFYAWIRLILASKYPYFKDEETPKGEEAIESKNRSLDYYKKLTEIFRSAKAKLALEGVFIFTFHHSDIQTWLKLSEVISNAGLRVVKTHTIPSEARNVLNIQNKKAIAFDLIIVCRTNTLESLPTITLEKFKILIKIHYEKRLDMLNQAQIKINGLDWLAIFFGVFLENFSKFEEISSLGQIIDIKEVYKACSDIIEVA